MQTSLAVGSNVTITVGDGDSLVLGTRGSSLVEAVSGLGRSPGRIDHPSGSRTLGPFSPGQIKLTAYGSPLLYEVQDGVRAVTESANLAAINARAAVTVKQVQDWFSLSFAARSRRVANGATPFLRRVDKRIAIIPIGTDGTALQNALNAAAALGPGNNDRTVLLAQNMTSVIDIAVPDGVVLLSDKGYSITITGGHVLTCGNRSVVAGIDFAGTGEGVRLRSTTASISASIVGNRFTGASLGVADVGTGDNSVHVAPMVALNEFVNCNYGTYWQIVVGGTITQNRFRWQRGSGRHVFFVGGRRNLVEYNWISGGVTGITALIDRTAPGDGFNQNIIRRNLVDDISEEGIGVDAYGNSPTQMSVLDVCVAAGTNGSPASSPGVLVTRNNSGSPTIAGIQVNSHVATCIKGPLLGKSWTIVYTTGFAGSVILQFANNSISQGDFDQLASCTWAIEMSCKDNVIEENVVTRAQLPISIYGCGQGTVVARNRGTSDGTGWGVRVSTLTGLGSSVGYASPNACIATPSDTKIYGNDFGASSCWFNSYNFGDNSLIAGKIAAMPHALGDNNFGTFINEPYPSPASFAPAAVTIDNGNTFDAAGQTDGTLSNDVDGYTTGNNTPRTITGTATFSGDGSTTNFKVIHSIGGAPISYTLNPISAAAAAARWVDESDTFGYWLSVKFLVAPAAAANNIVFRWSATL